MATPVTAPASKPASSVEAKPKPLPKAGFDPLRPVRYATNFVSGTIGGALDGTARWGRKGMWLGTGLGVLAMISTGMFAPLVIGWAAGLVGGAAAGGLVGTLTGGARTLQREHRRTKYSEDLLKRAEAKSRPGPAADYRDAHRDYTARNNYNIDRIFQQEREISDDSRRYFRDSVTESRYGGGWGKGH